MNKIMLFVLVSVLSVTLGCDQEQSYLEGTIEEVDEKNITMLVKENKSKVGKTDKVWLTREQYVDFEALEKGKELKFG